MQQKRRALIQLSIVCVSWPLGFTLGLQMGLQPFPSLHLPIYRLVRQPPHSAFDQIICFSSAVHVFCIVPTTKDSLSFFSTSHFSCLVLASLCGVTRGRECEFNQRAGQPPPLMILSTSRLSVEWGRGGVGETECLVISAAVSAKSHVNMTADSAGCPRRQIHPAATCKDGMPQHVLHREGERER